MTMTTMKAVRYIAYMYMGTIGLYNMSGFLFSQETVSKLASVYFFGQALLISALCFSLADKVSLAASKVPRFARHLYNETRAVLIGIGVYNVLIATLRVFTFFMDKNRVLDILNDQVMSGISFLIIFVLIIYSLYGGLDKE